MKGIIQYNKKGFLLPDSIKSMAAYHAKIMEDGKYMFRIHDCLGGVRLVGDMTDQTDLTESVEKLRCLASAANDFADFIERNYQGNKSRNLK